jgi:Na+/phosphate symporter
MVMLSSLADMLIIPGMAMAGLLMTPLAPALVLGLLLAAVVLAFVLDAIKAGLFRRLKMA